MTQGRTDRDWIIVAVMTFGAGALLSWALTTNDGAWPELTVEQGAAWVQAIGSIIAIFVAIAIPAMQRWSDKKAREKEKRSQQVITAGAIQPTIDALRRRASFLKESVEEGRTVDWLKGSIPENAFDAPSTLDKFHSSFHLLDGTGELANRFVASLYWLQQGMHAIHKRSFGPELRRQIRRDCDNTIELAQNLAEELAAICGRPDRRIRKDKH
ncbi:hypothetical protein [Stenotrophomonas sp. PS02301]|uniref:hypothetical protein n=1 Tax=Stenotrophomonas sp. PS02301 TaxID=2991427 RepID=UPI00249B3498|nr:hypothetical protein [Stenotrophomonas sp. PS02301]